MSLMELQLLLFFWHELLEDKEDLSIKLASNLFGQHAMVMLTDDTLEKAKLESLRCQIAELNNDISICTSLYESLHRLYQPWAHLVACAAEKAANIS